MHVNAQSPVVVEDDPAAVLRDSLGGGGHRQAGGSSLRRGAPHRRVRRLKHDAKFSIVLDLTAVGVDIFQPSLLPLAASEGRAWEVFGQVGHMGRGTRSPREPTQ